MDEVKKYEEETEELEIEESEDQLDMMENDEAVSSGNTIDEFAIEWVRRGKYAAVSAPNGSGLKNRILRLKEQYPDQVDIQRINPDGSIFAHIPVSFVKLRGPRIMTDEQKEKLVKRGRENMAKMHAARKKKKEDEQ